MTQPTSSTQHEPLPRSARAAAESLVRERTVTVDGRPARVFVGGTGEPLLLVHGGWGGASMHWAPVWERLAQQFRILAPDLPGIGRFDQDGLGSVDAYARWLVALLDALEVPDAWCVGNSFGASVVCRLAADQPERCRGLVLVNGFPMPPTPRWMRWLGERRLGHRLLRSISRRMAYGPSALRRAFVDPERAPEALRRVLRLASPPQLDPFVDILVQGGGAPGRYDARLAPLLLWGHDDRLMQSTARAAEKLRASWPGAKLAFVARAGHMPQLENPDAFVTALVAHLTAGAPVTSPRARNPDQSAP